jgi:hypothetical protein
LGGVGAGRQFRLHEPFLGAGPQLTECAGRLGRRLVAPRLVDEAFLGHPRFASI